MFPDEALLAPSAADSFREEVIAEMEAERAHLQTAIRNHDDYGEIASAVLDGRRLDAGREVVEWLRHSTSWTSRRRARCRGRSGSRSRAGPGSMNLLEGLATEAGHLLDPLLRTREDPRALGRLLAAAGWRLDAGAVDVDALNAGLDAALSAAGDLPGRLDTQNLAQLIAAIDALSSFAASIDGCVTAVEAVLPGGAAAATASALAQDIRDAVIVRYLAARTTSAMRSVWVRRARGASSSSPETTSQRPTPRHGCSCRPPSPAMPEGRFSSGSRWHGTRTRTSRGRSSAWWRGRSAAAWIVPTRGTHSRGRPHRGRAGRRRIPRASRSNTRSSRQEARTRLIGHGSPPRGCPWGPISASGATGYLLPNASSRSCWLLSPGSRHFWSTP